MFDSLFFQLFVALSWCQFALLTAAETALVIEMLAVFYSCKRLIEEDFTITGLLLVQSVYFTFETLLKDTMLNKRLNSVSRWEILTPMLIRGLLRDCEIFANLRLNLQTALQPGDAHHLDNNKI